MLKTSYQRGGAGYYIIIKHAGGYSTVYMHLSKALVRTGQKVSQGQVIALSGNTGGSTGPHLHYEVRINGRAVDAMRVDLPGGSSRETVSIDWNASKEFANDVAGYKGQLSRAVVIDESNAEQFLKKDSQTAKTQSGKSGKAGKASSSGKAGKSGKASSSEKKGSGKASSSKKGSGKASSSKKGSGKASSSKKGSGKASASGKKGSGKASSGKKGSGKASSSKKASGKASSGRKQSKGSSKSSGRKIQKK